MREDIILRIAPGASAEKARLAAAYLLEQAHTAPEVVDILKASGSLKRRRVARQDEASDLLTHPDVEATWQLLAVWARRWPRRLAAALPTWLPDVHAPPVGEVWDGIWRMVQRAEAAVLGWITSAYRTAIDTLRVKPTSLGLGPRIRDVFAQATLYGLRPEGVQDMRTLQVHERTAVVHARRHAEAVVAPLFTAQQGRWEVRLLEQEQLWDRIQPGVQTLRTADVTSVIAHTNQGWERDWARVVRTELQRAYNEGVTTRLLSQPQSTGMQVYRIPSHAACPLCRRLYLMPDGSPRLYALGDLVVNGTNAGRLVREALPTAGPSHPNCLCSAPQEYLPLLETTVFARMRAAASGTP